MGKPSINAFTFLLGRGSMQDSNKPEERKGLYLDRDDQTSEWRYNRAGGLNWANPSAIKERTGLTIRLKLIESRTKLVIPYSSKIVRIVLIGDGTRVLFFRDETRENLEGDLEKSFDCSLTQGQELIIGTDAEEAYGIRVRVYPL